MSPFQTRRLAATSCRPAFRGLAMVPFSPNEDSPSHCRPTCVRAETKDGRKGKLLVPFRSRVSRAPNPAWAVQCGWCQNASFLLPEQMAAETRCPSFSKCGAEAMYCPTSHASQLCNLMFPPFPSPVKRRGRAWWLVPTRDVMMRARRIRQADLRLPVQSVSASLGLQGRAP